MLRFVLLVSALLTLPAAGQERVIRFGKLVDGTGRVVNDAVVVINADTIVRVGTGDTAVPRGAAVTDLRQFTGIPGMIDVHTHMTYAREKPAAAGAPVAATRTPIERMAANAMRTLETGVTTVRDLGASNFADVALRDSINRGVIVGPRMFVAGHGLSRQAAAQGGGRATTAAPAFLRGRIADTTQIAPAIKAQVDGGADWIKMYGSTGSYANVTGNQTFTFEEMRAAVEAAHKNGKKIAIHSYGPAGARDATRAGAESVEHATDLDDATIADMARRGTFYVPTIDHNRFYAENATELRYTVEQVAALNAFRARNLESAQRAVKAGVKFAMGSDAVDWMFGENTRELGWFVKAGMTPAQALGAATSGGAELLGMSNKLGKVSAGYYADIVAVEGDPLADIDVVISKVRWVMKSGKVVVDKK